MIDDEVRRALESQLDEDERLLWATKSKGVWVNRVAMLGLILVVSIMYFLKKHTEVWAVLDDIPIIAKVVFGFIVIYLVASVFAPLFSYHILTSKRIMETTNIPFVEFKSEMYFSLNMRLERAKWLGPNTFYVRQSAVQRAKLGKFNVPVAAGVSYIVLHGVVGPDAFENTFYNS